MNTCRGHFGFLKALAMAAFGSLLVLMVTLQGGSAAGAASPPGYWLGADDGGVFAFGAPFFGSTAFPEQCGQGCAIASWPAGTGTTGQGYWMLGTLSKTGAQQYNGLLATGADGSAADTFVISSDDGNPQPTPQSSNRPWRIAGVPNHQSGVLIIDAGGNVYIPTGPNPSAYPMSYGSMAGEPFLGKMVGIASTPDGNGYWMVASDGGVFAFGDAPFEGSMGGKSLNAPVVAIASTPDGKGYWLAGADGGVFAFGDATFEGSMAGVSLNEPVVGIAGNGTDSGYWLAASDGGVFAFGSAPFRGSLTGRRLNAPITSIAASL